MGEILTQEEFAGHLRSMFSVQVTPDKTVDVELVEVSELKQTNNQEEFSLLFRGPAEFFLGQGTREVHHPKLGDTAIFLVPVSQDPSGYYYEAVFNRIRESLD